MKVAVPRETAPGEHRVALVPDAVTRLVAVGSSINQTLHELDLTLARASSSPTTRVFFQVVFCLLFLYS